MLFRSLRERKPWVGPRFTVFAARRGNIAPRERTVCSCKQVGETQINAAIARGADVAELKATLGCGTVCGSCVPELKRLCDAAALAH